MVHADEGSGLVGIRTRGLLLAKQAIYQLIYEPVQVRVEKSVRVFENFDSVKC